MVPLHESSMVIAATGRHVAPLPASSPSRLPAPAPRTDKTVQSACHYILSAARASCSGSVLLHSHGSPTGGQTNRKILDHQQCTRRFPRKHKLSSQQPSSQDSDRVWLVNPKHVRHTCPFAVVAPHPPLPREFEGRLRRDADAQEIAI